MKRGKSYRKRSKTLCEEKHCDRAITQYNFDEQSRLQNPVDVWQSTEHKINPAGLCEAETWPSKVAFYGLNR